MHHIHIVLDHPSHPGNIGAAARALKTMGIQHLHLVKPERFPHIEATARAAGADDVLDQAKVHDNLASAVANCRWVLGTSARPRHRSLPRLNPREAAQEINEHIQHEEPIAIVFGNEKFGLSNDEMHHCQAQVSIPTDTIYSSLNLAAAVQIMAYECRMAIAIDTQSTPLATIGRETPADAAQIQGLADHFHDLMSSLSLVNPQNPHSKRQKLLHLFQRARTTTAEIDLLRGFLKCIDGHLHGRSR